MRLKFAEVGTQILIYVDADLNILDGGRAGTRTLPVWLVAGMGTHPTGYHDSMLLGWKHAERRIRSAWDRYQDTEHRRPTSRLPLDILFCLWLDCDVDIMGHVASGPRDGMYCQGCKNWVDYAKANRTSGNFVCWSCRQGFVPDEW